MLLGEPPQSSGDLRFRIGPFPARITPGFWLATALLGWSGSEGNPHSLLAWIAAVFVSILIHELGHAVAFRYYDVQSHVVLYHFGGLAVPTSYGEWGRKEHAPIVVSAAGPVAQFLAAAIVIGGLRSAGYGIPLFGFVQHWLNLPITPGFESFRLWEFVHYFLYVSVYWALINLLPIYPLDGGQIARELFLRFGASQTALRNSLILSIVSGGIVAFWGLTAGDTYIGIMFGLLAYSSYTALQQHLGSNPYGRGW